MLDFGFYNDDCLNILPKIESESIDCIITDCPYHIVNGGANGKKNQMSGLISHSNELTRQGKIFEYNEIGFSQWLPEIYRIAKDNSHVYIMVNARNLKGLQQAAESSGFVFQNLLIWDKGNSLPNKYYMNSYELILMLRKGRAKNINNMGTSNILRVPNIVGNKRHPTEKPVELMKILIENSTNKGDVVLDPFMGVGSTCIAAKETEREFIGIEIDTKYYDIAAERLKRETAQMNIFDFMGEEA